MPDGKANYGFLGGGSASALEQLITTGDHETAHDVPLSQVWHEAQPRSMGPRRLWNSERLNTVPGKTS